jgi:hypothetical protein
MNKLVCGDCGAIIPTRGGQRFAPGEKCGECGGNLEINIKGTGILYHGLPTGTVRIPRRFDPYMKDGTPCNKSAIRGAIPTSVPGH